MQLVSSYQCRLFKYLQLLSFFVVIEINTGKIFMQFKRKLFAIYILMQTNDNTRDT